MSDKCCSTKSIPTEVKPLLEVLIKKLTPRDSKDTETEFYCNQVIPAKVLIKNFLVSLQ